MDKQRTKVQLKAGAKSALVIPATLLVGASTALLSPVIYAYQIIKTARQYKDSNQRSAQVKKTAKEYWPFLKGVGKSTVDAIKDQVAEYKGTVREYDHKIRANTPEELKKTGAQTLIDAIGATQSVEVEIDAAEGKWHKAKFAGLLFNIKSGQVWRARQADFYPFGSYDADTPENKAKLANGDYGAGAGKPLLVIPANQIDTIVTAITTKHKQLAQAKLAANIAEVQSIVAANTATHSK